MKLDFITAHLSNFIRIAISLSALLLANYFFLPATAFAATDTWTTSLYNLQRTSAGNDTTFSATNAAQIAQKWSFKTGGPIAAAPIVANNTLYVGSWDGYMYALDANTGAQKWKTYLGVTIANPVCIPPALGISSTATVYNGVVYVGGGDANWYALDAATGSILWSVYTGDNSATGGHYNWSSPLIFNGYAYIGIASLGDCPLVQGKLLKVDLATHLIVGETKFVPDGQVGGGMWQSPSLDPVTKRIFLATGTENSPTQQYAQAMVAVDADTMQIVDSWKLPESEAVLDSDFSTTAIVFDDANGRKLVAAINKNGDAYAFDRNNIAAGPVWQKNVAIGDDCPTCGATSVSSPTFQQGKVFFSGAGGVINGYTYKGTVRAIDPATGNYIWQYGATGSIIPAITSANGLIFSEAGSVLEVLNAATGERLFSYDTGAGIYSPATIANGMVYTGNLSGKILAFSLGQAVTPPADANCPVGFTCQDIGSPTPAGSESNNNGTLTVQAGGSGINGTSDSFRYLSKTVSGDAQVSTRIQTAAPQTSVMLRQSNDPQSPYYAASLSNNNTLTIQYRKGFGQAITTLKTTAAALPAYVAVQRVGDTFQTAVSTDGINFTLVPGTTVTFSIPTQLMAGVAVSSANQGTIQSATVSNVVVGAASTFQPLASAHPCPTGWSCQDIGNPTVIGDQSLSGNVYTVSGAGDDIWDYKDAFHFVWQTLPADGTLTARVASQTNTDQWAKAGLMMRQSTDAASTYYAVVVTPSNGVIVQYRDFNGFTSSQKAATTGVAPQYLRIGRSGNTFTAYVSADGVNWTFIPGSSITLSNISGSLLAGMAVTSHNGGLLGTATFDAISLTNTADVPPNVCPTGWTCKDIGFPTPAGDQTLNNGNWTIDGGGGDIWDTIDSFRYIYQVLPGDGKVSTKILSQSNSNAWAKAGMMVRQTDDQSAPYYAIFTTPQNGTIIQYRLTQAGGSNQIIVNPTVAPEFVRIERTGTTFTASVSADGTTWNAVAGSSVSIPSMTGSLFAGMAVTSHNTIDSSQVVFNTVSISGQGIQTNCPDTWTCQDIGATGVAGSTTVLNNVYTLKGSGWDIWTTDDMFHFASQALNGDGSIVARITSQTNTNQWAKAGVMIKESNTVNAKYVFMGVTPSNGYRMQYNFTGDTAGGIYTFPNSWVKLTRSGNVFTTYTSQDGNTWNQAGTTTLAMNAQVRIGLFVTAHDNTVLSTATFDNVSVSQGTQTTPTPTPSALPAPWQDKDINTGIPGLGTFTNGVFTLKGAGWDIWQADDMFHFTYQTLNGDGDITARITSQNNTNAWAKAGVMIKESATANAKYVFMGVTPANGYRMQYNFTGEVAGGNYTFPNAWVRLSRTGDVFTAYRSVDGATWQPVGTTTLPMNTQATIGLFDTAHDNTVLNTTTFDNVTVNP